jgi:molybdopterin molybdotransferase
VHAEPPSETVPLLEADGRVLAEDIAADRDYPALARSIRDGFAVRSSDQPRGLQVIGEVRAGETYRGSVAPGQAVEIMTGAPVPPGADAVIMVEHVRRNGDRISTDRGVMPGEFILAKGAEARSGDTVLPRGRRLGFAGIAMAATAGCSELKVYRKPRVAILATGDEVVGLDENPLDHQIRNSNSYAVAAQVRRAGGIPEILPVAGDTVDSTLPLVEYGLEADMLVLVGGVSAGKYDIVESVLSGLGAHFYFDRVKIQPGQPLVFGAARNKFFFGLPGNPGSAMVTFELFARAALERLTGLTDPPLPLLFAKLTRPFRHTPGLTRFLPALLDGEGGLTPVSWQGSSDIPALVRANAFMVAEEDRERWDTGDLMRVLLK